MAPEQLCPRALNRALLHRQGLLERSAKPAIDMVDQLVGMQAQVPSNPYIALWSRVEGFEKAELSDLLSARRVVRAQLMRATIHLVTAADCLAMHPLVQPHRDRVFRSPWGMGLESAGVDADAVAAAGRAILAEGPQTRAELSRLLAPRWPDADPAALGQAVTFRSALVQVPPRGLWGGVGQATWALAEDWLDADLDRSAVVDALVLRYLAAFGPATVADMRTWSGLAGLREVVDGLRPQLRTFRDASGRELLDVADGPLPDPGTPAPPRFLPEYDNVVLSHAERSRILNGNGPGLPFPRGTFIGTVLADGFYRANWQLAEADGVARLTIDRFTSLPDDPAGTVGQVRDEGLELLRFVAPDAGEHRVVFAPEP